ncbi:MAG: glycosyltransferase [Saprospiraceae bacterium]
MDKRFLVVRGLPGQWEFFNLTSNVEAVAFLTSKALNEAILSADVLVSRSGYSTILDLVQLQKPALLVPTPGQTEQEYLAKVLDEKGYFASQSQEEFNLAEGIETALQRPGLNPGLFPEVDLDSELEDFLRKI